MKYFMSEKSKSSYKLTFITINAKYCAYTQLFTIFGEHEDYPEKNTYQILQV